jgi:predicted permease
MLSDLRFSLRLLARTPGFTATAIAVLALGIGVNTAIFSVVHELAYSARPFPDADQVVQLYTQDTKNPKNYRMFSYPVYREILAHNDVFSGVLAHNLAMVGIGEHDTSRRTFAAIVSANYFSTLGVTLPQGRAFTAEEEKPDAAIPVVVASDAYWKKAGRDPHLVGKTIKVNERQFTVVGIAPPNFTGTMVVFSPELFFPTGMFDLLNNDFTESSSRKLAMNDAYQLILVGRLKPGVTQAVANEALRTLATGLQRTYPAEFKDQTMLVGNLPRLSSSNAPSPERNLKVTCMLLLGMSGIVLLISCLNLANMLLARGAARRKEFAVRLALGGGRTRIVRQLLTEGFVLALGGGFAGLLLAFWSADLLVKSLMTFLPVPLLFQGAANPAVFVAALTLCAFATLMFALGPALKLSRGDILTDLKEQPGEDTAHSRRLRWLPRNPLVVAQVAFSLGLLCTAGLFMRGAYKAAGVDTGLKVDDTILIEADASLGGMDEKRAAETYRVAAERLAQIPGVQSAAIGSTVPFGMLSISHKVQRFGIKLAPDARPANAAEGLAYDSRWNSVGADYFATVGLPLLRGRAFTQLEATTADSPPVAIIDETLAKKLWPDGDALGQRLQFADRDAPSDARSAPNSGIANEESPGDKRSPVSIEVVGIVPATRAELFDSEAGTAIYVPFAQGFQSNVHFHIRTAPGAVGSLIDTVRHEFRNAAPGVPMLASKSFKQHLDGSFQLWIVRTGAAMFSVFGGLALILAVVGIYGVKAYSVARRTREIGIRMALGAEPGAVQRMILREGLVMTLSGAAFGVLLGAGLGQLCRSMLYDVSAIDPVTFIVAPAVLISAAMLACWLPARRATRVNPLTALRSE